MARTSNYNLNMLWYADKQESKGQEDKKNSMETNFVHGENNF